MIIILSTCMIMMHTIVMWIAWMHMMNMKKNATMTMVDTVQVAEQTLGAILWVHAMNAALAHVAAVSMYVVVIIMKMNSVFLKN